MVRMVNKQFVTTLVKRLTRAKADHDWIGFASAVNEVIDALNVPSEVAQKTLFALIASGEVSATNRKGLINLDETTIAELSKIDQVAANELRTWLREHSTVPMPGQRDFVIGKLLRNGAVPARSVSWKEFCDKVRNECNGWKGKGTKREPAWGFDNKTIQRQVAKLTRR